MYSDSLVIEDYIVFLQSELKNDTMRLSGYWKEILSFGRAATLFLLQRMIVDFSRYVRAKSSGQSTL